ncbi:hypothetical protein HMPREF9441_00683 [Paraprevotella clara YIT 11840]|uniref:Uncharacterized protein n=1 Tax=Paraprevotella clara YIT 11840 TaxID=762968 RepID=G5SMV7_9BACT|nr:hypothetical protein HMPREF9441_00683 [Paraprevotella clara YIT 11840]
MSGSIFSKNLVFPNRFVYGATETKTTEATGRRIKKMSDYERRKRERNSTPSALKSA